MDFTLGILATGSEVLDGRVLDTNSQFIIQAFSAIGVPARHIVAAGDDFQDLEAAFRFLENRVTEVVIIGGLGPTEDDLTRDLCAKVLGVPLEEDPDALQNLKRRYAERKRTFDPSNARQALFPKGSTRIQNRIGTAWGFCATTPQGSRVYAVPGVPGELRRMVTEWMVPHLTEVLRKSLGSVEPREKRALKIFGLTEAAVGERVVSANIPPELVVSYRASFPEIHVVIKERAGHKDHSVLPSFTSKARASIGGEYIFSEDIEESFPEATLRLLLQKGVSISVAESCTGGMLGELLTAVPGSSASFRGGVISYDNSVKSKVLGVPPEDLARFGAVSAEVACAMARGVRALTGSDYALSVTGIAGPGGGTEEKPVGLFFAGIATRTETKAFRAFYPSTRPYVRRYSAFTALDILRREILGISQLLPPCVVQPR